MKQIRTGVFETNSSSVHSICISKDKVKVPENAFISFCNGEVGWEFDTVKDSGELADYLYTAILDQPNWYKLLNKFTKQLKRIGVKYEFNKPNNGLTGIDHGEELSDFVNALLNDDDLLIRYLFGKTIIYTGNDNEDYPRDGTGCYAAKEFIFNDIGDWIPNPNRDNNKYDYFIKYN